MSDGCERHRAMPLLLRCGGGGGGGGPWSVVMFFEIFVFPMQPFRGWGAVNSVCEQSRNAGGGGGKKGKEEKGRERIARGYVYEYA